MRVLDINLDFFQAEIAYWPSNLEERLADDGAYKPWSMERVRIFLEQQCGLSPHRRLPGVYMTHHDDIFFVWKELIAAGRLSVPFEVVHVDAHADLGMGDASWKYVMGDLLHLPMDDRQMPLCGGWAGLNEGNFLVFAVACRWLSALRFVKHPDSKDDLLYYHFKDFDEESGFLQLKKYDPNQLELDSYFLDQQPLEYEPKIPFETIELSRYREKYPFDFVFICQSPRYTVPSADRLIPVIRSYIDGDDVLSG